jgi:Zn-finger nucleic acid-binding protein
MGSPLCPECGEVGRLVQLRQENIEFYWCGHCFVRWPSREEPMEPPDQPHAADYVEPDSHAADRHR